MPSIFLHPKLFSTTPDMLPTRNGYGDALVELGERDDRIVVLTGDLTDSTRVNEFQKKFPKRFIECGIAEQNMMGIAAGLALSGKIPFVSSYAVFSPGRSWDQLRVSVCYAKANVKIAGAHTGVSVGPDGATHQALEDLAITRVIPDLMVVAPCDYEQTRQATLAFADFKGPAYLRFTREKSPQITTNKTPFELGKILKLRAGSDVTLISCGPLTYETLMAARLLSDQGVEAEVLNCHTLKPFDVKGFTQSIKKTGCCVTIEEHQIIGGLFGTVSEAAAQYSPVPIEPIGMPNSFGESGEPAELLKKYGMTTEDIVKAAQRAIQRKKRS